MLSHGYDLVLRSVWGFPLLTAGAALGGLIAAIVQFWITGVFHRLGPTAPIVLGAVGAYAAVGTAIGVGIGLRMERNRLRWYREDRPPTPAEVEPTIRLPVDMAILDGALWLPGVALSAVLTAWLLTTDMYVTVALLALSGLINTGLTYLVVDKALTPAAARIAAAGAAVGGHPGTSVLVRLVVSWVVISGVPLASSVLILTDRSAALNDRVHGALYVAVAGLVLGVVATLALARAVALPLRRLRRALHRIGTGDLDTTVPVDSLGEIGLLQASVNDMAESLRERRRMNDVFGRHVGRHVAERALSRGLDLSGDIREVSALFVDVVGSTTLAHRLEPAEFVDKLNRLLSIVVEATDAETGLVNKFEGDAALCIFGAPLDHDDDATAALRAARRIRDAVCAAGELDIGVGVARGRVFAGDVGSDTRLEYTVIGDPVNEAARLTECAKQTPQRILVSQAVVEHAGIDEQAHWTAYGVLALRGRDEETKTWTPVTAPAPRPALGPR